MVVVAWQIQSIELLPTNRVQLAWSSTSGEVYAVERTFAMTQPFTAVAANLPAMPPQNLHTAAVPAERGGVNSLHL